VHVDPLCAPNLELEARSLGGRQVIAFPPRWKMDVSARCRFHPLAYPIDGGTPVHPDLVEKRHQHEIAGIEGEGFELHTPLRLKSAPGATRTTSRLLDPNDHAGPSCPPGFRESETVSNTSGRDSSIP